MNDELLDTSIEIKVASPEDIQNLVAFAIDLMKNQNLSRLSVVRRIIAMKYSESTAIQVVDLAEQALGKGENTKAVRDIVVGGIFLILGLVLTFANIGAIFYGAIIFGGIQCVRGIINLSQNN